MKMPTAEQFLRATNGRCRERLFDALDYGSFRDHVRRARRAAKRLAPYYREDDAGGVSRSYKYAATTARWGVYTTPDGAVKITFDRSPCYGEHPPCVFHGGEKSYAKWFRESTVALEVGGE